MLSLNAKVALITGAGSGMGRAAAQLFASLGAQVVCADIDIQAAAATAEMIEARQRGRDGGAVAVEVDVSRASDVEGGIDAAEAEFGGLDILYNNAGLWLLGQDGYVEGKTDAPSPLLTEDIWDRTLDVNLKGTYLGCRFAIPALRRRGGGSIINVSSVAALRVGHGASDAYTAAKGGVLAITRSLAVEHAKEGIRVNCIVPGAIETPLVANASDEARAAFTSYIPLGRWGKPEEVANMAAFLASDASSFCTGQIYVVDGGYLAL